MYDAIIVGGGPAGLNAALVLGRAQRRILLCDSGEPRNRQVHHTHGFLSRDGIGPAELRTIAGEQLTRYPAAEQRRVRVERIERHATSFRATLSDGAAADARRVLLATGVITSCPRSTRWPRGGASARSTAPTATGGKSATSRSPYSAPTRRTSDSP